MGFAAKLKKLFTVPFYKIVDMISHEKYAKILGVKFGRNCRFYGKVYWSTEPWIISMGDNVHITDEVRFITHDGAVLLFRDKEPTLELTKPIKIGNNVYIGTRAMIRGGVTIGNNVIIGAGSMVTHNIPDNSVAVGVPAKVIKTTDEYFEKAKVESIGFGDLKYSQKDKKLKEYYKCKRQ